MLTLKSRYEFWFCILALHKLGAITIPATHMLKTKDIIYRIENAGIKMVPRSDGAYLSSKTKINTN
jgi:acetyl-CoA synthetase